MTDLDRRIRARRRGRAVVDPWRPLETIAELERRPGGAVEPGLTLLLAGSECPFTCIFCDLWRHTLVGPTPVGALPAQIARGIEETPEPRRWSWVKLYNASNFFDPRAVPAEDHEPIARAVERFERVVVEAHPRLVGESCLEFAARLRGRLEVAVGLETVHPGALPRLNKQMDLALFDAAARFLGEAGIGLRAFVLLGTPFVPAVEQARWTVASVRHALCAGAAVVSVIPVRPNDELERLRRSGGFQPPSLELAEEALEGALALESSVGGGVVQIDPWDLERLGGDCHCVPERRRRLRRIGLSGSLEPSIDCRRCGGGGRQ